MAPPTKSSNKTSVTAATAVKKGKTTSKPPPIDKLLIPAIGLALALLAYQFFKGITAEVRMQNIHLFLILSY